ncbi:MAG TPA: metal-dependent hydrolase [Chloroflexi bacterium]|nr:metal-dependent hydrolase [Chloroflexota bacterium]
MKGISHFITGVALATFFPEVVRAGAQGSLLPMLGGIAGILPDTLDFKFARYFEKYDIEIDPGPEPDVHAIAEQVVGAMRRAYETGEPQNVMLHTIRLGADLWRQYTLRFIPEQNEIGVRVGPIVNTGQSPLPGSEPEEAVEVRLQTGIPIVHTYDAEIKVDIFSGPSFKFERQGDKLRVHFLDWHRRWSHSLTLAAVLGLLGCLILGPWGGLVAGLGFAGHILEDQLGFMGSNLFYPFSKKRTGGLQWIRSGDAIPNFLTVWTAVAVILFNLDRFSEQPLLNPACFLGLAIAAPLVLLGGVYQWQRRRAMVEGRETQEALRQADMVAEAEAVGV